MNTVLKRIAPVAFAVILGAMCFSVSSVTQAWADSDHCEVVIHKTGPCWHEGYTVYNKSDHPVVINGTKYPSDRACGMCYLSADSVGDGYSCSISGLPYGLYLFRNIETNSEFWVDFNEGSVERDGGAVEHPVVVFYENPEESIQYSSLINDHPMPDESMHDRFITLVHDDDLFVKAPEQTVYSRIERKPSSNNTLEITASLMTSPDGDFMVGAPSSATKPLRDENGSPLTVKAQIAGSDTDWSVSFPIPKVDPASYTFVKTDVTQRNGSAWSETTTVKRYDGRDYFDTPGVTDTKWSMLDDGQIVVEAEFALAMPRCITRSVCWNRTQNRVQWASDMVRLDIPFKDAKYVMTPDWEGVAEGDELVYYQYLAFDPNGQEKPIHCMKAESVYDDHVPDIVASVGNGVFVKVDADSAQHFVDHIVYGDLQPGQSYTVKTVLSDGAGLVAEHSVSFVPDSSEGAIDVPVVFDASKYAGQSLSITNELYDEDGNLVARYDGSSQKVHYVVVGELPKTGVEDPKGDDGKSGNVSNEENADDPSGDDSNESAGETDDQNHAPYQTSPKKLGERADGKNHVWYQTSPWGSKAGLSSVLLMVALSVGFVTTLALVASSRKTKKHPKHAR